MTLPDFQIPEHKVAEVLSEAVRLHTEQLFKEPEDVMEFANGSSLWYYGNGHLWFNQSGRLELWSDP